MPDKAITTNPMQPDYAENGMNINEAQMRLDNMTKRLIAEQECQWRGPMFWQDTGDK